MIVKCRWLTVLLPLLAGCSQTAIQYDVGPAGLVSEGSRIQLHSDVKVQPQQARVFFQRGEAIAKGQLDYYHPSCDIEIRQLSSEVQVVRKDIFTVTRIVSGREQVVSWDGLQVAGFSFGIGSGWGGGGLFWDRGASIHRFFRFDLHSEAQPDVMRLTCRGAWDDYHSARLPTSVETRIALGEYVTFL